MVGRGKGVGRSRGVGRPSSGKAGARGGVRTSFVASTNNIYPDTRQSNGFTRSQFSLSEEARNTERLHAWNSDLKLRHSRIAFISAGTSAAEDLYPVIKESKTSGETTENSFQERSEAPVKASENRLIAYAVTPTTQLSNMTLNDQRPASTPRVKSEDAQNSVSDMRSNMERCLDSSGLSKHVPSVDLEYADEPVHKGLVTPLRTLSPSPTRSDSSGEVIIFAGRRQSCKKGDQRYISDARLRNIHIQNASKPSGHRSCTATVIDDPIYPKLQEIQASPKQRPSSFSPPDSESVTGHPSCHSRAIAKKIRQKRRGRHPKKETRDEGIIDDYIANLRNGGDLEALIGSSVLKNRDLGDSVAAEWQNEVESPPTGLEEPGPRASQEEWDSTDLKDFDELSTSNEILESIERILSKRERPSGVQYLVVGAGCVVDDARWLPVSLLNSHGAEPLIQQFEDNAELDHLLNSNDVSDASSAIEEQVAQDLQDDLDDKEDEEDIEERRKARLTDEQIARLLSKQGELGLGSDDLMIFDGGDLGTDSHEDLHLDGLWKVAVTHRAYSRSKKRKSSRRDFPSATAFADVLDQDPYDGFDVMDQQRPSLRKGPKGRRGKLSMELSDSELEQSIHTAWEKDRTKKKKRKQEREELRAQGFLGNKNKFDLKAKYSEGISMTEVKNEIRKFLQSSMESLPLPPMAQGERKKVHEIANVFKLKSKSTGGGKHRFPILYRTSRTIQYNEETLEAVDSVLSSGHFLPRMDKAKWKGALAGRGRRSGAASAGVSYRDGEVVGAAAPEIGQENRGRTMLERMGWSTGTALGALNNSRGLVQPVAQVVKTSRSGLG